MGMSVRAVAAAHLAAATAVLAPILANPLPPLVDFPKLMAVMHVLHHRSSDPVLQAHYVTAWGFSPYLAIDVLFAPLLLLWSPIDAGRVYLGVSLVLTGLAPAVLHRTLYGGLSPWPLLGWLLVYHHAVFWGFYNYVLAAPLVVLAFTAWLAARSLSPLVRAAAFTPVALGLMTCHLFAWGAFGLLVAGELLAELRHRRIAESAWAAAPFAITFVLWRVLPPPVPGFTMLRGAEVRYGTWGERVRDLSSAFNFDFLPTDLLTIAAGGTFLYWLVRERRVVVHERLRAPLSALLAGVFLMPHDVLGGWGTLRLPIIGMLALVGSTLPKAEARRAVAGIGVVGVALFAARIGDLTHAWGRCQPVLGQVREALRAVEPGSTVVQLLDPGEHPECPLLRPMFSHVAAYATIDRSAFSPQILGNPSVHPSPGNEDASLEAPGWPRSVEEVDEALLALIRARSDYVLYVHPAGPAPPPPGLVPVVEATAFTLLATGR